MNRIIRILINTLVSVVRSISQDTIVMFFGIIARVDNNGKYNDTIVKLKVNKLIMDVLGKLNVEVIDNSNINPKSTGGCFPPPPPP